MIIDTKKTSKTPKDQWEAIEFMNEAQQLLVEAICIMDSAVENDTEDFKEMHQTRMKKFIKQFEK